MEKQTTSDEQDIISKKAADRSSPNQWRRLDPDAQATAAASHTTGNSKSESAPEHTTVTAQVEPTTSTSSRRASKTKSIRDRQRESASNALADAAHHSRRIRYPSKFSTKSKHQRSSSRSARGDTLTSSKTNVPTTSAGNGMGPKPLKKPRPVSDSRTTKVQGQDG
ncbi:hypothetical protein HPB52_016148 [Rhipicephalus sanguineus]|uniref:Uncharacterized protein n=1 Tax=Rhipicephalus sanguineus TaxID=34632 RepID=A0A9D4STC3_RHISA|nr:hypothetical protein HPB52_016148 [Rhipicephalus sanguineus]